MSIRMEILSESASDLESQLLALAEMARPLKSANPDIPVELLVANLKKRNLDEVLKLVREVFDPEGYEITVAEKEPKPEKAEAAAPKKSRGGRPGKIDAETAKAQLGADDGNGADKSNGEDEDRTNEQAREKAMKRLHDMFADPKRKAKAVEFTSKVSKANGGKRVSDLPAEKFPDIWEQLEAEFGSL